MKIKWLIYNVIFIAAYLLMAPMFFFRMRKRGGYKARFSDRFGRYPKGMAFPENPIWIHAVSVGEVAVAGQLMREMRKRNPDIDFVFSTTSSTGWKVAQREITENDVLIYNPVDFPLWVRRAFDRIKPRAVILTETELWPNFILEAKRRGLQLYLVNARISDRSAPRYKALRFFFGDVLRAFTKIYSQSTMDTERLVAAGADADRIKITGSVKFDVAKRNEAKENELRDWVGGGARILLGGSTWPGEDEALLRIYRNVLKVDPSVRLVIAPRHFEKANDVEANIAKSGFKCVRRSRGDRPSAGIAGADEVLLCDTTGEMMGLFGISTVAFVGKSLCAHGSQNMIEPCLCGVPTLVGPYTENFRPVMADLLEANAIIQVKDEAELNDRIVKLFSDESLRAEYGARATAAVERRRGATALVSKELLSSVPSKTPEYKRRIRWKMWIAVLLYAFVGWYYTPAILHEWRYLEQNVNRKYSTYLWLNAVSCVFPWLHHHAGEVRMNLLAADYGFAKGKPYKTVGELAYYRDEDYGSSDVILKDGYPVKTGDRFKSTWILKDLFPRIEGGNVKVIDARGLTMGRMKALLDGYASQNGGYRLWAVGRFDYIVTSRNIRTIDFYSDLFDNDLMLNKLSEAGIYSAQDLFASYIGSDGEVAPAFKGMDGFGAFRNWLYMPRMLFRPELAGAAARVNIAYLTPETPPDFSWLLTGSLEKDFADAFFRKVNDFQLARRQIIRGYLSSGQGSIDCWKKAAAINPRDPLMQNIKDSLDMEARRMLRIGNANGALHCYQNYLAIFPGDISGCHNFGVCMKMAGHPEIAAQVFMRLVDVDPENDAHRLDLAECAAAGGMEEVALKQLDYLAKKHPDDQSLKNRAVKIRAYIFKRKYLNKKESKK